MGGSGGALGELWEALAELREALGELWEGLYIQKFPINRPSGRYVKVMERCSKSCFWDKSYGVLLQNSALGQK